MFLNEIETIEIDGMTYKINCTIGQGGAGIVYHVCDSLGEQFALKMIKNYKTNSFLKQSVDSQIKIQKLFKGQKYIINCFGQKIVNNNIYILFELGEYSLRNKIQMNHLIQDEYIQMLVDVTYGLMLIHQKKIIHRDIKPQNVIYSKGTFKITDFGTSTQNQTTSQMAGTVIYWAPQLLFEQEQQYTQAVDIWSLGVLAFQAYFLIHPFFYNKQIKTNKEAIAEIKRNIQAITPNFTFGKLISHLKKLGYDEKAQFIDNKLQHTHQSLIHIFRGFFVINPKKRVEITMLLGTIQSIQQDQITRVQVRTSRLLQKEQPPPDVEFFVKALNLFYKLNHDYYYKLHETVEYNFQLGLRLLAVSQHKKKDFIHYQYRQKLSQIQGPNQNLHDQIKSVLSQYYFYLKQTKQIQFFQELPVLRTLVCICSCWHLITLGVKHFLKKISQITNLNVKNLMELQQLIPAFTQRQLASIENFIICEYFC